MKPTTLLIRIADSGGAPASGEMTCDLHTGGPSTLLHWLEIQLGLLAVQPELSSRISVYASALDQVEGACFAESFSTDRWGTASELLVRREELRLAGWDETESDAYPVLVRHMARAAKTSLRLRADIADRLSTVLAALEQGQKLPPHECLLGEPMERWPKKWRPVLARLKTAQVPSPAASAREGTALAKAQSNCLRGSTDAAALDDSLRWIGSRSMVGACEAIACALENDREHLANTVVCCENDSVALCLDGCLERLGLPTMGAATRSLCHPALQVLPLALRLCWSPVDPATLLDFLTLPLGPIRRQWARPLAQALAEQPGLGSRAWDHAMDQITAPENDPENKAKEMLARWLSGDRVPWGESLLADTVKECCGRVAQWAAGRAQVLTDEKKTEDGVAFALQLAAGQASSLGKLAKLQGSHISEPQLARLLEASTLGGAEVSPTRAQSAGPRLVRSLAEIHHPCDRLIWLGLGSAESASSRWTAAERIALSAAGIELDDGSAKTASRLALERAGISYVKGSMLAVSLPSDETLRTHPVWLQIMAALVKGGASAAIPIESILEGIPKANVSPWHFPLSTIAIQSRQPKRPQWQVKKGLLTDREKSSATELQTRLACPLAWVFQYAAKLHASPVARLPDDFRLKGSFCHQVFEEVLGKAGALPSVEEAVNGVTRVFHERLPLDAAPLAQPARINEQLSLLNELKAATRTLVSTLRAGQYQILGIEVPVEGNIGTRTLDGSIDCLVSQSGGGEAIIDFKYGGKAKYRKMLSEGRAVQLATYAHARGQVTKKPVGAVGYLIISEGLLLTPSGSALARSEAADVVEGDSIPDVWNSFQRALQGADDWVKGKAPIHARPLQEEKEWPEGATLVLQGCDSKGRPPELQESCKYCDYSVLCGLKELA